MLLVIAAVVGIVVQSQRSSSGRSNLVVSPSAKGPGGSMLLGSPTAPVLVEEYGDFQCPHCGEFEKTTYPTIVQLVNQGKIRFAFHFFTFIGPESFALANTSICAADQGKFWPVHDYFYANQQPENSGYWTTARLIDVLKQFGVDNPTSEQCVRNHTYYPWLRQLADQASQRGVTATPTIFVNGTQLDDTSPAGLTAAVNSQTKSG
ncbi:MAG TPA: thioredoxin domain-containing protein [Acidimicrobiales bacterium]|nr:thioredoxin domain-containing protein [Acidimicrobiales bacterium]